MADKPNAVIAALLLGCVGVFAIMSQPILVEVLVASAGFAPGTAAQITALEALGTALGPVLALAWMGRMSWRRAAIGALLVVIAGNTLSSVIASPAALMLVRFLVGLLGEGTAFALAIALIGSTEQKDRNFAFLIAAQVTLGVLFFLVLPLPRSAGIAGVMLPLAALALLALATTGRVPQVSQGGEGGAHHGAGATGRSSGPAIAALVVMLVWCTGLGAVWAFIKLIGVALTCAACDESAKTAAGIAVGQALGLSTAIAVAGAFAAAALADRFGRVLPVTLALGVQVAMVLLLQGEMAWLRFAVTAAIFQTFWNFTGPYVMGTIAQGDGSGRVSVLIPTAQIGGFFLGPTLAGQFLDGTSLAPVNIVGAACIVLALVLFIPVARHVGAAART
jgi:predicted MFS family arabinose efflux permease